MSPYVLLIPAILIDALGAWLTYSFSERQFYAPCMMAIGGFTGGLWTYGVALAEGNKQTVYLFDLLFVLAGGLYMIVPLFIGVRFSWQLWPGIVFIAAGLLLVKLSLEVR